MQAELQKSASIGDSQQRAADEEELYVSDIYIILKLALVNKQTNPVKTAYQIVTKFVFHSVCWSVLS